MPDIQHRVGMTASIEEVFDAVGTRDGVAKWWTNDVEGGSDLGDRLAFSFGFPEPWVTMEIVDLVEPTLVRWRCVEGPDEWKDTTVTFEMKTNGEETVLLFTHGGWREQVEFMYHCSSRGARPPHFRTTLP